MAHQVGRTPQELGDPRGVRLHVVGASRGGLAEARAVGEAELEALLHERTLLAESARAASKAALDAAVDDQHELARVSATSSR